ncbi:hypothetical protein O0L34_g17198 [Tuta absoluta]|nr:hypothetical protein O0L34_g17198 [Tuta absoluta]
MFKFSLQITEAYVPVKNKTESGLLLVNTTSDANETDTSTVETNSNLPCNGDNCTEKVLTCTECISTVKEPHGFVNSTVSPCNSDNCTQNVQNCTECPNKVKESHGADTVLKYVYKKDDKVDRTNKTTGNLLNSLKRRRSVGKLKIKKKPENYGLKQAASAPLIVNYETSHGPPHGPTFARQTNNVINGAHLADFNIETRHDVQANRNIDDYYSDKQNDRENDSKLQEEERSDDGEDNSNVKSVKENDDSAEREEPLSSSRSSSAEDSSESDNDNVKRYKDNHHDEEESQEKHTNKLNNREKHEEEDSSQQSDYKDRESQNESTEDTDDRQRSSQREHRHDDNDDDDDEEEYRNSNKTDTPKLEYSKDNINYKEPEDERQADKYSDSNASDEKKDNSFQNGKESNFNQKDRYPTGHSKYSASSKYNEESGERSEEKGSNLRQDSRENLDERNGKRSGFTQPRDDSSERYTENPQEKLSLPNRKEPSLSYYKSPDEQYYNHNNQSTRESSEPESEEEAIIAIMKRKHRNRHDEKIKENLDSPIRIKDVDLGDFENFERIHVNKKGIVQPVLEKYENYDTHTDPPGKLLPDQIYHDDGKRPAISTSNADNPANNESIEEKYQQTNIDDEEVKPVVELNTEKGSIEYNSKEALVENPNEDVSLETLLGVREPSSGEIRDKKVKQSKQQDKEDVKQQFERIPLNYNHAIKEEEQSNEQPNDRTNDEQSEPQKDPSGADDSDVIQYNPKEPVQYDEHLNIKFDDVRIKLPDIKLPDDILTIPYEETSYAKKDGKKIKEPKKEKFFHYDEQEYNSDDNHEPVLRDDKTDKEDDVHDFEPGYYKHYKNDYKKKEKHSKDDDDDDEDEEEEDLYEKFVRERFGKTGTFEKRSARLTAPTVPDKENEELFQALDKVLKKAANIEKEAQQSGDPNAGYVWTVEYEKPL